LALVAAAAPLFVVIPAQASISQPHVVSEDPANFTPNVQSDGAVPNPAVYALAQRNGQIYAGGEFQTIANASQSKTFARRNLMSFSATTGQMSNLSPDINAPVWAVRPKGSALYVGGEFTHVNGIARRAIVKIDADTGQVRKRFNAHIPSGSITEVRIAHHRLIVGGSFPGRLRALSLRTGATTNYFKQAILGQMSSNAGPTSVYRFTISPDSTRLVAMGNFTSVGGEARSQAFMLDLGSSSATLDPWYYQPLENECAASTLPAYLRDVDFSPDGSYFVIVSTGYIPQSGGLERDICDATARFETAVANPDRPTWINYTGGDTLHSVAVTGAAVYVQGHQRWLDNPFGNNSAGPGAVSREGIGAIDPTTGKALSWNPTKTRGVGGKDFLATSAGLWVASDGELFHGEYRARIAFCPL